VNEEEEKGEKNLWKDGRERLQKLQVITQHHHHAIPGVANMIDMIFHQRTSAKWSRTRKTLALPDQAPQYQTISQNGKQQAQS